MQTELRVKAWKAERYPEMKNKRALPLIALTLVLVLALGIGLSTSASDSLSKEDITKIVETTTD